MKQAIVFVLIVCAAVLGAALPNAHHHHLQQAEESSEESSRVAAAFQGIGFAVGLCNCFERRGEESSEESSMALLDCFCREANATVDESSEASSGAESSVFTFNPRANLTGQALLGCTCLFKPNEESSEESFEESSFLLPTYTGREIVPIDCMCKDLDDRTVNLTTNPLLEQVLIPVINSSSKINFQGDQVIGADIPLSRAQGINKLIPVWCNASAAALPFFNGTIINRVLAEKSFVGRCAAKLMQPGNVTVRVANGTLSMAAVPVPIAKWGRSLIGIDATQVSGLAPNQQVEVLGLNITWTNVLFKITNTSTPVQAPPFIFVGPDVLNTFPVIRTPNVQGIVHKLRKRYLF